jgi:hypothetical protein
MHGVFRGPNPEKGAEPRGRSSPLCFGSSGLATAPPSANGLVFKRCLHIPYPACTGQSPPAT